VVRLLVAVSLCAVAAGGPLTAGRVGDAKARLLRKRGGNAATEKAVARALAWLAAHQAEDGSWDADGFDRADGCDCEGKGGGWHGEAVPCPFDREVTALATLAFLGAGHAHREGEHKETVARALDRMRRGGGRATLFAIAFETRALAEAFDLTGDETLRDGVRKRVAVMLDSRQPDAGWRYWPGSRMSAGVPTTSAVASALRVADEAGFRVETGFRAPVLRWLDRLVDRETGRVKYHVGAERLGYTPTTANAASALLVRAWLDQPRGHPEVARGRKALARRRPKWSIRFKRMKVKGVMRDVQIGYLQHYYWDHGTEALARLGGGAWSAWNRALKRALLPKQRKDGHAKGSWDPVGTYGKVGGRVFSTALCALMLEAYYRYPSNT